ncbi:hypothetical protein AVEN_258248-1 [Araneus ventricosus]|uniref:Uncharacterized protein n=1 Tax=Araneus ventricosus TaxID=182803 RepID=A0A4Y2M980_ARAVE|nr:hypothetical protein AVEN_258248-1 [Araneus ventricosus]
MSEKSGTSRAVPTGLNCVSAADGSRRRNLGPTFYARLEGRVYGLKASVPYQKEIQDKFFCRQDTHESFSRSPRCSVTGLFRKWNNKFCQTLTQIHRH